MLKWIKWMLIGRSIKDALNETKTVRIEGVRFVIRKISPLNFVDGSNILDQNYAVYKTQNDASERKASEKKLKEYFSQVLVAGVVSPRLTFKKEGEGIFVEDLFAIWTTVEKLHEEIMSFTYGKKKYQQITSLAKGLPK